jgi:biopolymer transport protein TolQ
VNNALFETFRQSGIVGQLIIVFLLGLSIYAWYIIVDKVRYLNLAERNSRQFLHKFRSERADIFSTRFPSEYTEVCPLYAIFEQGLKELGRIQDSNPGDAPTEIPVLNLQQMGHLEEALRRTVSKHRMNMEHMMIVLAITATISPLMGLLGTVWGIMTAFQGMAASGSASIGTVAPGISEALVTTVVGLLVAIPALTGYNVISSKIRHLAEEMNNFVSEFIALASRGY